MDRVQQDPDLTTAVEIEPVLLVLQSLVPRGLNTYTVECINNFGEWIGNMLFDPNP